MNTGTGSGEQRESGDKTGDEQIGFPAEVPSGGWRTIDSMQLQSYESLDFPLAWRRVRTWARSRLMDIPDRLPYEVLDRLAGDAGPALRPEHNVHRTILVVSSKKSGTIRPFVRVHPRDLILYQALVDRLAATIESALPPSDRVGAYRQTLDSSADDAFAGSPRNDEFKAGVASVIESSDSVYVLQADVSGYFLGIEPGRLRSQLWEITDQPEAVSDLNELLMTWQTLGVRGLPQGLRPSSPLANFYLSSLDRRLGELGVPFHRWVDDLWAISGTYGEARQIQDVIERHLYALGLTLNGEKTRILRGGTARERLEPAKQRFEHRKQEAVDDAFEALEDVAYTDEVVLPDPDELERDVVHSEFERQTAALAETDLSKDFYADMAQLFRELEAMDDPHGLDQIPSILRRAPELTSSALRYVTAVADEDALGAAQVLRSIIAPEHAARDHERLIACHRALSLPANGHEELAEQLARLAVDDPHELTRAKALVAWGKHSDDGEFEAVDRFLEGTDPHWRAYAFVAMQLKEQSSRDARYERWGGAGGALGALAKELSTSPIKWTKL